MAIKIEAFLGIDRQSEKMESFLAELEKKFKDKVKITLHKGKNEEFERYRLKTLPALVIEGMIKIQGICPNEETFLRAIKELGYEENAQ